MKHKDILMIARVLALMLPLAGCTSLESNEPVRDDFTMAQPETILSEHDRSPGERILWVVAEGATADEAQRAALAKAHNLARSLEMRPVVTDTRVDAQGVHHARLFFAVPRHSTQRLRRSLAYARSEKMGIVPLRNGMVVDVVTNDKAKELILGVSFHGCSGRDIGVDCCVLTPEAEWKTFNDGSDRSRAEPTQIIHCKNREAHELRAAVPTRAGSQIVRLRFAAPPENLSREGNGNADTPGSHGAPADGDRDDALDRRLSSARREWFMIQPTAEQPVEGWLEQYVFVLTKE